jgi:stearoyl-CoA desaturase (Delta-9 desaturase)
MSKASVQLDAAPATERARRPSLKSLPFLLVHLAAVGGVLWLGWSWSGVALALGLYALRMLGVTAGYHRYFSHRSYRTSRAFQFVLAWLATSSAQKGVLWWAAHHRVHHKLSDQPGDVHSVRLDGFWWSHVGWIVSSEHEDTDLSKVQDLARFPELRWLERWHLLPAVSLGVLLYLCGGAWALVWGLFVSTTLLWHGTFTINSLSHVWGKRRFSTSDDSRNNFWLALITLGEGWHNNHHHYQRSTAQGFYWWEIDLSYYALRALAALGIVWDLHVPPPHVLAAAGEPVRVVAPVAPVGP